MRSGRQETAPPFRPVLSEMLVWMPSTYCVQGASPQGRSPEWVLLGSDGDCGLSGWRLWAPPDPARSTPPARGSVSGGAQLVGATWGIARASRGDQDVEFAGWPGWRPRAGGDGEPPFPFSGNLQPFVLGPIFHLCLGGRRA